MKIELTQAQGLAQLTDTANWSEFAERYAQVVVEAAHLCFQHPNLTKPVLSYIRYTKPVAVVRNASANCIWPEYVWKM